MTRLNGKSLPKRSEIEDKFKWKLEDIYKSDEQWEQDFKNSKAAVRSNRPMQRASRRKCRSAAGMP